MYCTVLSVPSGDVEIRRHFFVGREGGKLASSVDDAAAAAAAAADNVSAAAMMMTVARID